MATGHRSLRRFEIAADHSNDTSPAPPPAYQTARLQFVFPPTPRSVVIGRFTIASAGEYARTRPEVIAQSAIRIRHKVPRQKLLLDIDQ